MSLVRIGTRSSPLALAQVQLVVAALQLARPEMRVEIVPLASPADSDPRPLHEIDQRGMFASHLEHELLAGRIDAAVHSAKDMSYDAVPGLSIAATLPREDARDALCGCAATTLADLPTGAVVATGSARRQAILRAVRPDISTREIRGNVATRLRVSRERGDDACMLARAGLVRLGLAGEARIELPVTISVPDAGQGVVVVQTRAADTTLIAELAAIDDRDTSWDLIVERSIAEWLGGGCEHPIGVHVTRTSPPQVLVFHEESRGDAASGNVASFVIDRAADPADVARRVVDEISAARLTSEERV